MGFWERISRGASMAAASWQIVRRDRSLLVFPVLASVFGIVAVVIIFTPVVLSTRVMHGGGWDQHDPVVLGAEALAAYVSTVIGVFFNVALSACVAKGLRGQPHTLGDGIGAATARLGSILGWSAIAVTVGLVLRAIEERVPLAGKIVVWIAEAGWAIATFFVVPAMVLEDAGPVQALKRSTSVIKARWGEGIAGNAAIGIIFGLIVMVAVLLGTFGVVALFVSGYAVLAVALIAITAVVVLVVAAAGNAVTSVFRVVLYDYATTGAVPAGFDGQMLGKAFESR